MGNQSIDYIAFHEVRRLNRLINIKEEDIQDMIRPVYDPKPTEMIKCQTCKKIFTEFGQQYSWDKIVYCCPICGVTVDKGEFKMVEENYES